MPDYYAPQTWFNGPTGGTPVSAARLNHMEAGIDAVDSAVQAVEAAVAAIDASDLEANGSYAAPSTVVMRTRVTADPEPRWVLHAGGLQEWGDGANPVDTNLQRTAPHTLVTGSDFIVGGNNLYNTVSAASSLVVSYFQAGSATQTPIMARGFAAQSANLTEWQASTGSVLSRVASDGVMYGPGFSTGSVFISNAVYLEAILSQLFTGPTMHFDGSSTVLVQSAGKAAFTVFAVQGAASQSGDLQSWVDSTYTTLASVSATGTGKFGGSGVLAPFVQDPGATKAYIDLVSGASGVAVINRTTTSAVPFTVRGMAAQSGDLQQWQDSTPTTVASIGNDGTMRATNVILASGYAVYTDFVQAIATTGAYLTFAGGSVVTTGRTTTTNLVSVVQGMAAQSGDLTQWQDSTAAVVARVTSIGTMNVQGLLNVGSNGMELNPGGWLITRIADGNGFISLGEQSADPTAFADHARLFSRDNGAGKTQFCVRFGSGAVQVIATEP